MIRVLNIVETVGSGGVERRRLSIAKLLNRDQFELKIICTNTVGLFPEEFKKHEVELIEIGDIKSIFDYKQHKKVQKIIDEYKPHIIHGAVFEGVTMAAINGFIKKVPIIIIEETSDPKNRTWKGNMLMKMFALLSDKVIGVSPAAVDYLENEIKIKKSKVQLINNGVLIPQSLEDNFINQEKKKYGIDENDFVIGSVGRMLDDSHKRFSDLIKAFSVFSSNKENIKLLLVGDGPEKEKYKKKCQELKIESKVIFTGYKSNPQQFFEMMNIFCIFSSREAFGLVVVEAMMHQLPVIATKVGGIKFIVQDQKTGYLIPPYNIDSMVEKMNDLYNNKELGKKMGKNGRERAILEFSEKRYVQDVQNLYIELCKSKKLL